MTMQIFRISFHNNGKVYQLHAQQVLPGDLYGFVQIRGLMFDEHTSVVVDPAEERLKEEFSGVSCVQVPMHAVIRVDQVEKQGQNKILDLESDHSNVTPFPIPGNRPDGSA